MNHVDTSVGSLIHNDVVRLHEIAPGAFVVVIDNPPVNPVMTGVVGGAPVPIRRWANRP
jgi:hypothetical protein